MRLPEPLHAGTRERPPSFPGLPEFPPFPWNKRARHFPGIPPCGRGPALRAALPERPPECRFPAFPRSSRRAGRRTSRRPSRRECPVRSRRKTPPRGNRAPGKGRPPRQEPRGFPRRRRARNRPQFPLNTVLPGHPAPGAPPQRWRRNGCVQLSIPPGTAVPFRPMPRRKTARRKFPEPAEHLACGGLYRKFRRA